MKGYINIVKRAINFSEQGIVTGLFNLKRPELRLKLWRKEINFRKPQIKFLKSQLNFLEKDVILKKSHLYKRKTGIIFFAALLPCLCKRKNQRKAENFSLISLVENLCNEKI